MEYSNLSDEDLLRAIQGLENEVAGLDSLQHGYKIAIGEFSGLRG